MKAHPNAAKVHRPYPGERCPCGKHGVRFSAERGAIVCAASGAPIDRVCAGCKDPKPLGEYQVVRYSGGRKQERGPYCRACRAERARIHRKGQRMARGYDVAKFHRWERATLLARTAALVAAAVRARSTGAWRGREGIQAYAALEPFKNAIHNPDALDDEGPPTVVEA
jgi:hypothetical protein